MDKKGTEAQKENINSQEQIDQDQTSTSLQNNNNLQTNSYNNSSYNGYGSSYGSSMYNRGGYGGSMYGGGMYGSSMYGGGMYGGGMYGRGMYGNQMNPQMPNGQGFRQEYQGVLNGLQSMLQISYGGIMLVGYGQFLLRTSKNILKFLGSKSKSLFLTILGIKYWKQLIIYCLSGKADKLLHQKFKQISKFTNDNHSMSNQWKKIINIFKLLGLITLSFAFKQYRNVTKSLKQQKQQQQALQNLQEQKKQEQTFQYERNQQLTQQQNLQYAFNQANKNTINEQQLNQIYSSLQNQQQNKQEQMQQIYRSQGNINNQQHKSYISEQSDNDEDSDDIEIDFSYQPSRKNSQPNLNLSQNNIIENIDMEKNIEKLNQTFTTCEYDDQDFNDNLSELNITQDSEIQIKVNFNTLNKKKQQKDTPEKLENKLNQSSDKDEKQDKDELNLNNNNILDSLNNNINDRSKEWNFGHKEPITQIQDKSQIINCNSNLKPLDLSANTVDTNNQNNIIELPKKKTSVKPWLQKKKPTQTQV